MPTKKHVAMIVWWLTNVACYHEVGPQFGVGLSMVAATILKMCFASELILLRTTVRLGKAQRVISTAKSHLQKLRGSQTTTLTLSFPCHAVYMFVSRIYLY